MFITTTSKMLCVGALVLTCANGALAQPGTVLSHQKISDTEGGFKGILDDNDQFHSTAFLGDLDGDGVGDLAVGAWGDDDGGTDRGAVWILFLNDDGTVKSEQTQKISDTEGGFKGILGDGDNFGFSVAALGDLNGDGVGDLAVGAPLDDDGGTDRGAVWILFLNTNGTVKSDQKISSTAGNGPPLPPRDNSEFFNISVASLGDLDGDGVVDMAVGASGDDDGGTDRGALWILFLNTDGTVKSHHKISDTSGDLPPGELDNEDYFAWSVASLGDLDGDGVGDLAVGAPNDGDGGNFKGAVWVLFLNTNGTVNHHQKISDTQGGFTGILDFGDIFGFSVAALGDLDGDGVGDLAVGAVHDDDGGGGNNNRGAVWILFLNDVGTVNSHQKISSTQGNGPPLGNGDFFGASTASLGDLDGDGVGDLAVGAFFHDDGGSDRGAVWILFLDGVAACPADLDGSGAVDFGDILAILSAWGNKGGPEDLDDSGTVDFGDILVVLEAWGPCSPPTPANDCGDAPVVGDGTYAYSTLRATTDGGILPKECDEGNGVRCRKDVWIRYVASCAGTATASVCDSDFDTRIVVYEDGDCPGPFLACNDDACGEGGTRSEVSFPVQSGVTYLIRIGSPRFQTGGGTLVIDCAE